MGDTFSNNSMLRILEQGLTGITKRHKALSNNIANVDTPNFKRSDVEFNSVLQRIIRDGGASAPLYTTNSKHMALNGQSGTQYNFPIQRDFSTTYRADGNNVDIEKEVAEMNKNAMMHQTLISFIQSNFSQTLSAIEEGRR
jgi:flagellar basal-body rod protein FlgB